MMNFNDFIYFIISEEDKTNDLSLEYWFRILDLDGDGILSPYELSIFFEQQSDKIQKLYEYHHESESESLSFDNILIKLNDIILPKINYNFTLFDIKKSKMGHIFFDILINIIKFADSENKTNQINGYDYYDIDTIDQKTKNIEFYLNGINGLNLNINMQ